MGAWWHPNVVKGVKWFGDPVPIEGVASKAVNMAGLVRGEQRDNFLVPCKAVCAKPRQCLRHGHDVVKDQQVGDEVVVLDELALLVPDTFGGKRATPKGVVCLIIWVLAHIW